MAVNHPAGKSCQTRVRSVATKCLSCTNQVWDEPSQAAAAKHPLAGCFLGRYADHQNEQHDLRTKCKRKSPCDTTEVFTGHDTQLIHRLWINTGPVDEDHAESFKLQLGPRGVQCLKTWQPCRQWFWVYYMSVSEMEWLEAEVKGLKVRFIGPEYLHPNCAAALLACGAPMQLINNILSLTLLHKHGGIYADLDLIWLGVPFPVSEQGYMFGLVPHTSVARYKSNPKRLTLSILAAPKASAPIYALYRKLFAHWRDHAIEAFRCTSKAKQIAATWDTAWMWNADALTAAVNEVPCLQSAVQRPVVLQPFSGALTATAVAHVAGGPVDDEVKQRPGAPYACPSMATVAKYSVVIHTWKTQWSAEVQDTVLSWVEAHRMGHTAANHSNTFAEFQSNVQACILAWLPQIQKFVTLGDAYALVGCAFQLLERNWSQPTFMKYTRLWPDGRPPAAEGLLGMLPERGIPITPEIWARVLLLWGLNTKAGAGPLTSPDASELLQDCLYKSTLESGATPFVTVKAALLMFSSLYSALELPG